MIEGMTATDHGHRGMDGIWGLVWSRWIVVTRLYNRVEDGN